jgi:hypothetical protein
LFLLFFFSPLGGSADLGCLSLELLSPPQMPADKLAFYGKTDRERERERDR